MRRASLSFPLAFATLAFATVLVTGCRSQQPLHAEYQMGERVTVGPLTYNVIETTWRSQLGEAFSVRTPQQRFLLITVSVTNGGGSEVSVPMMQLQGSDGKIYNEVENGEGVENWFGLLRSIHPAQTQQGQLIFDVPLSSYHLRLPDGSDLSSERYANVNIPLHIDADAPVEAPLPGKK